MGQFYYAAKAFDVLERLDPNPEYWEGKRGACVGVFQLIIAGHEQRWAERPAFLHMLDQCSPMQLKTASQMLASVKIQCGDGRLSAKYSLHDLIPFAFLRICLILHNYNFTQ